MIKHFTEKMYAIVVNYNELPGGKRKGTILKHGSISLYHNDLSYGGGEFFGLAWSLGNPNLGSAITLHSPGGEHDLSGDVQIPGVSLFWSLTNIPGWRWVQEKLGLYKPKSTEHLWGRFISREFGWRVFNSTLWVDIWRQEHQYNSADPWWTHFTINLHPMDLLFGKMKYSDGDTVHDVVVDFPMPEKSYKGRVRIQANEWKRSRWPWPKIIVRAHVDMEEPIPFPGKGENSWDCGDDALHGSCFPCRTVEGAIGNVVGTVLRNRKRYGGSHQFVPKKAAQ